MANRMKLVEKHGTFLSMLEKYCAANAATASASGGGSITAHARGRISLAPYVANPRIAILHIENAKKKGSIDASMMLQLATALDTLETTLAADDTDTAPLGLICISSGDFFCSGLDLNLAKNCINTSAHGSLMCDFMSDALARVYNAPLVSVSVIGGPALGGGSELVLATDYRIMRRHIRRSVTSAPALTPSSNFIQSVHARIGAAPGWGGASRLTSIVGRKHALRMLGTSCPVCAEEALQIGLVDEILSDNSGSSSTSPCTSTSTSNLDDDIAAGVNFLSPWLEQRYPGSVRGMKRIVSASSESDRQAVEAAVFGERWFGRDNRAALGLPSLP